MDSLHARLQNVLRDHGLICGTVLSPSGEELVRAGDFAALDRNGLLSTLLGPRGSGSATYGLMQPDEAIRPALMEEGQEFAFLDRVGPMMVVVFGRDREPGMAHFLFARRVGASLAAAFAQEAPERPDLLAPPAPTPENERCGCRPGRPIKLMQTLTYNPIHCLECNREVSPESLTLPPELTQAVSHWRNLYDAIDRLWLDSGAYEAWAEAELSNLESPVNREGRALQAALNPLRRCYYYGFQGRISAQGLCPSCGQAMTALPSAGAEQLLCEDCSLVFFRPEAGPGIPANA
jgi:hypothetical protein